MASPMTGVVSSVGDPAATRTVYGIVIGLSLIGVALVVLGIWLIRQTRVDAELLGPLERMADRRWRKLDPAGRRRLLDDVRPDGAEPVVRTPHEPEVDSEFEREPPVPSFDDLEAIVAGASGASGASPPDAETAVVDLDLPDEADHADGADPEVFAVGGEPAAADEER